MSLLYAPPSYYDTNRQRYEYDGKRYEEYHGEPIVLETALFKEYVNGNW